MRGIRSGERKWTNFVHSKWNVSKTSVITMVMSLPGIALVWTGPSDVDGFCVMRFS